MKITIETIKHEDHRYSTCGDWYTDEAGNLVIKVSDLGNWREEFLIGVHELIEWAKCKHDGVTQQQVDAFDTTYEEIRENRLTDPTISEGAKALIAIDEPGDDANAPYRNQHALATGVERIMAAALNVCWADYEKKIEALP